MGNAATEDCHVAVDAVGMSLWSCWDCMDKVSKEEGSQSCQKASSEHSEGWHNHVTIKSMSNESLEGYVRRNKELEYSGAGKGLTVRQKVHGGKPLVAKTHLATQNSEA